jgi:hypothetical protein
MGTVTLKGTIAAVVIAASCHAATAAPLAPLTAPSPVIEIKDGRNAAAAVGAVAGAAILLGILGGAANASTQEYYIEPEEYGYVEPRYGNGGYHAYVRQNPRLAAEVCRKGVLRAARKYGARRAVINNTYGFRYTRGDHRLLSGQRTAFGRGLHGSGRVSARGPRRAVIDRSLHRFRGSAG